MHHFKNGFLIVLGACLRQRNQPISTLAAIFGYLITDLDVSCSILRKISCTECHVSVTREYEHGLKTRLKSMEF